MLLGMEHREMELIQFCGMIMLFQEESIREMGETVHPCPPAVPCCYHLTVQLLSLTTAHWGGFAEVDPDLRTHLDPAMEMICTEAGKMQYYVLKWDELLTVIHYQAWECPQKMEFDVLGEVEEGSLDRLVRNGMRKSWHCNISLCNDLTTVYWLHGFLEARFPPFRSSAGPVQTYIWCWEKEKQEDTSGWGLLLRSRVTRYFPDASTKGVRLAKLGNNISGDDTTTYSKNFHLIIHASAV